MKTAEYDEIVIGQGLAGTALAWALRWRGRRLLVIDRQMPVTSSRIAAGLMTPITGQRLVTSWRWNQFWPAACAFYARVESQTRSTLFHRTKMVRLLASEREREFFNQKSSSDFAGLIAPPDPAVNPDWFEASLGAFEMIDGGRLDVPAYLDASRQQFLRDGQFLKSDVFPDRDLELTPSGVQLPRLHLSARRILFCQGIDATLNTWFSGVQFNPAKGEILTVRIEGLPEQRIVHRGVWLMPLGGDLFRTGATYDCSRLDCQPTEQGQDEISERLRQFLRLPFQVVGHDAAVRPILHHQYPAVGLHPQSPQLGFFNGLGSKGSLQAPWIAEHFAGFLVGDHPLDPELDLQRTMSPTR